jgi:hypothetical protein
MDNGAPRPVMRRQLRIDGRDRQSAVAGFPFAIVASCVLGTALGFVVVSPGLALSVTVAFSMLVLAVTVSRLGLKSVGAGRGVSEEWLVEQQRSAILPGFAARFWPSAIVALIPVTFLSGSAWLLGFRPSGFAWLILLAYSTALMLHHRPTPTALAYSSPLSLFLSGALVSLAWSSDIRIGIQTLAQFGTVLVVYLVGTSLGSSHQMPTRQMRQVAWLGLGIAAAIALPPKVIEAAPDLTGPATRSLAITLVPLLVFSSLGLKNWKAEMAAAGLALVICLATGSRTATVVVAASICISAALRQNRRNFALICAAIAVAGYFVVNSDAFKQRMFHSGEGSLADIVTLHPNFDTAGRVDLWFGLVDECRPSRWLGQGFGSADRLTADLTAGVLRQPHNDYLRIFCDTGLIGSILFWAFILAVLLRASRVLRLPVDSPDRSWAVGTFQLSAALLLFAISDNVLIYTAQFMAPAALVFSQSDVVFSRQRMSSS